MTKLSSAAEKKSRFAMERGRGRARTLSGHARPEGRSSSSSFRIHCRRQNVPRPELVSYRHVLVQEISNSRRGDQRSAPGAWHQPLAEGSARGGLPTASFV